MEYSFDNRVDMTGTGSAKWEMADQVFEAEGLLPMWVADMDFRGPDPVIRALKERAENGVFGYTFRPGYMAEAVAGWLKRRHRWTVPENWITFSPGVVAALRTCVACYTAPGDGVIVQPPVYPPFFSVVKEAGRELVLNPLQEADGRYRMDFDDLRLKARDSGAKMLILCSPHNPIGRVWTREELETLASICTEYDITVVSDEIHADLVFQSHVHTPFAALSPELEARTIVCMAPSKTFNMAGLHSSFIIIPDEAKRDKFDTHLKEAHLTMMNPFSLTAANAAYRYGDEWLDSVLAYIEANIDYFSVEMAARLPELRFAKPEGTYMVWLDCRPLGMTPDELKSFMLREAKIAINDGSSFGEEGAGFIRVNLAAPRSVVEEGISRLEAAVKARKAGSGQ
ncbi:MalY/PatB family protein [Paenibacillus humicola]|uniref:MalY/PatB family protein n=1 Tax=Paenibacillus humicola TaxID=3110540 RepID=UPI00237A0EC9|nr:MalY/PatB family protein [Paenibacillus humicola]